MRLGSAQDLKQQLIDDLIAPFAIQSRLPVIPIGASATNGNFSVGARSLDAVPRLQRSVALGVALDGREYGLAIRVQRPALLKSPLVARMVERARGEADVRMIGRIDKRGAAQRRKRSLEVLRPWYQQRTRPLNIGASVAHYAVTAGTIGAFVTRAHRTCLLSNNHVLANEDEATVGDAVLQPGRFDAGRRSADVVAGLYAWVRLKRSAANLVDAAVAELRPDMTYDPRLLRGIDDGQDRMLAGVNSSGLAPGDRVRKVGRTTGPTSGHVTAFAVDNVVVGYEVGNLRFDDQIEIEGEGGRPFSDGGDSGSLIVDDAVRAAALLFAGSETGGANGLGLTYANPIQAVLTSLKAHLLF